MHKKTRRAERISLCYSARDDTIFVNVQPVTFPHRFMIFMNRRCQLDLIFRYFNLTKFTHDGVGKKKSCRFHTKKNAALTNHMYTSDEIFIRSSPIANRANDHVTELFQLSLRSTFLLHHVGRARPFRPRAHAKL